MMRIFRQFFFVTFVSLYWACTDSTEKLSQPNIPNVPEDYDYTENDLQHLGMVKVHAAGHSVLLGTNDSLSTSREHPQMKVEFSYDYSISAHEVTHAEYAEVMGGAADEINRFLPIRNVTYYDAILMANRKSIKDGFDTVYTYSKKNHNAIGNCINMADLVFHPEVEGYRLPTEAEWVYAASLDFVPENSWNGGNSGYDLHDYCSKGVRSSGLCDMEGNVKEWVNDWLGFFRDTTVENYVGAPDGGSLQPVFPRRYLYSHIFDACTVCRFPSGFWPHPGSCLAQ